MWHGPYPSRTGRHHTFSIIFHFSLAYYLWRDFLLNCLLYAYIYILECPFVTSDAPHCWWGTFICTPCPFHAPLCLPRRERTVLWLILVLCAFAYTSFQGLLGCLCIQLGLDLIWLFQFHGMERNYKEIWLAKEWKTHSIPSNPYGLRLKQTCS